MPLRASNVVRPRPYPDCNGDCGENGMYCCDGEWDTRRGGDSCAAFLEQTRGYLRKAADSIDLAMQHVPDESRSVDRLTLCFLHDAWLDGVDTLNELEARLEG